MSFTAGFIKTAIKLTPKGLVTWVANRQLKGIAQVKAYDFNLDTRRVYGLVHLVGEAEPIEVSVENFAVVKTGDSYAFFIPTATANRIWLTNLLARITGRAWKIPDSALLRRYLPLILELVGEKAKP